MSRPKYIWFEESGEAGTFFDDEELQECAQTFLASDAENGSTTYIIKTAGLKLFTLDVTTKVTLKEAR